MIARNIFLLICRPLLISAILAITLAFSSPALAAEPPPGAPPGGQPVPDTQNAAPAAQAAGAAAGTPVPAAGAAPTQAPGAATVPQGNAPSAADGFLDLGGDFMSTINSAILEAAIGGEKEERGGVFGFVMNEMVGAQGLGFSPIISCNDMDQSSPIAGECKPWFQEQLGMMRQLGLWLVTPLMMLVIIQSILRGSLFLLLRAALIMLPAAIFGSVVLSFFAQLLLNISDDLTAAMFALSDTNFESLRDSLRNMETEGLSWFGTLFAVAAVIGGLVIIIELVLREVGVYVTVLFLPLCFAGLVWPASAKWAKRLAEILVGLIFSKVFIAAGIALGLGAIEQQGTGTSEATAGFMAAVNAAAIFIFAAIFGIRIMAWTPGGEGATTGRIGNPASIYGMGEFTSAQSAARGARLSKAAANVSPGKAGYSGK